MHAPDHIMHCKNRNVIHCETLLVTSVACRYVNLQQGYVTSTSVLVLSHSV